MAQKRVRKASQESRKLAAGESHNLFERRIAYLSLSVGMPWQERLKLANAARARNVAARKAAAAKQAELDKYGLK